ncbi:response regulator transcription factor [Paraburkholderia kururiensis]|uniref:response regulator transcription factor n=1 Tax=Paraburkholderia kururiensis TaxID=984307 RepID=UPI0018F6525E|nr:response regulator transcription factor [Paraburkholderia kururiensis]
MHPPSLCRNVRLAVVTGSASLFGLVSACFGEDGATCVHFADSAALARASASNQPTFSAILMDAQGDAASSPPALAQRSGHEDSRVPLIAVGIRGGIDAAEQLLDAGADEVVLSPVDSRELVLRVHLALRRTRGSAGPTHADDRLVVGAYALNRRTCTVHIGTQTIDLTPREFAVAWILFSRCGEYVSRRQMAGAVWSSSDDIVGRTLEQHIYKLRKKLELNSTRGVQLRAVYARGYQLDVADVATSAEVA